MKTLFILFFIGLTGLSFAQKQQVVTTEDGRRVLLNPDFTWQYLDAKASDSMAVTKKERAASVVKTGCQMPQDYKEPKLNAKIQNQLIRGHATISDIKEKVAKDNEVPVSDVILMSASEHKSKGEYHFCVNGKIRVYKRIGTTILKKGGLF